MSQKEESREEIVKNILKILKTITEKNKELKK